MARRAVAVGLVAALGAASAVGVAGVAATRDGGGAQPDDPCVRSDGTWTWTWPPITQCIQPGYKVLTPDGAVLEYTGP